MAATVLAQSVTTDLRSGLGDVIGFLPRLVGFLVLLLIGYVVARIVMAVLRKGLEKAGVDRKLGDSGAGKYLDRVMPEASPSRGIGRVAFWLVFAFFAFSAIGALQVPALTAFMNQVLAYLPNILAALLIFVVAAAIAGAAGAAAAKLMGDTPTGKIVGTTVPALVMVMAVFMVLEQLQIAPEIVRVAFAAMVGALALGLALAFGLGGRPVAQRMLEEAYTRGQEGKEQVRKDAQVARERGGEQADRAREKATDGSGTGTQPSPAPAATPSGGTSETVDMRPPTTTTNDQNPPTSSYKAF